MLPIAPSTYHAHVARRTKPETALPHIKRDVLLSAEIRRVFDENLRVYGLRKVWRQLQREGFDVARCIVARLMRKMGLQGEIRGKRVRTTVAIKASVRPIGLTNSFGRHGRMRCGSLASHMSQRRRVSSAFLVIDAYARRIVGWRVSRSAHAGFVLDALEQALHDRKPVSRGTFS